MARARLAAAGLGVSRLARPDGDGTGRPVGAGHRAIDTAGFSLLPRAPSDRRRAAIHLPRRLPAPAGPHLKELPLQGRFPLSGEMSRRDKRGGAVSRRPTGEVVSTLQRPSVRLRRATSPRKGRLWAVLICKIIRHYGNIAIYAKHPTLRYNNSPILKEKRLRFRAGSGILRPAETDSGCVPRCSGLANHKRKRLKL